jgi:CrcB protein
MPPVSALAAVAVGAVLGAWLRWLLVANLNPVLPFLPMGTLLANIGGGLLVGLAIAWLAAQPQLHPAVRLFVITGFLGALTTFSSFSAESLELLYAGRYGWALAHSALHVFGSLAAATAGFAGYRALA